MVSQAGIVGVRYHAWQTFIHVLCLTSEQLLFLILEMEPWAPFLAHIEYMFYTELHPAQHSDFFCFLSKRKTSLFWNDDKF